MRRKLDTSTKLNPRMVREIRALYHTHEPTDSPLTMQQLADRYGVSLATISNVIRGVTWPRVGGPITPDSKRKLSPAQVVEIRKLAEATPRPTLKQLAEQFDVSITTIGEILSGKRFPQK